MKKLLLFLGLNFIAFFAMAQHETIFGDARVVGGFGSPIFEFGLGNDLSTSSGGGGGVVIGNAFLGGYGMASVNLEDLLNDNDIKELEIGHGGFWLGYTYKPYRLVHLYSTAKIGWGAVNIRVDNGFDPFDEDTDQIFVLTPELGLEVNIFKWFRVAGAAGYRWVNGTNGKGMYEDEDFSGTVASLTLRFGWFGRSRF